MRWLFWDLDFDALDVDEHADAILPRVLASGRLEDCAPSLLSMVRNVSIGSSARSRIP